MSILNHRVILKICLFILISAVSVKWVSPGPFLNKDPFSSNANEYAQDDKNVEYSIMILPANPSPGQAFRILTAGPEDLSKAQIIVKDRTQNIKSNKNITGEESPFWRIDDFKSCPGGRYEVNLIIGKKEVQSLEFIISKNEIKPSSGNVWKNLRGWDSATETIYSAWINCLFHGCDEHSSWSALHEVIRNPDQNFLYNYLSIDEDNPNGANKLIMQPDCADNPFFLRAYFAWKLGLPFGYHMCDRGYPGRSPKPGQWITNESGASKSQPVQSFNSFLRRVMNDVHSGTARTSLDDENSDYYPVPLERSALRPGTVFADPYGHTLILVSWVPQTKDKPGLLLSVDAQPDGTVGIKRFWKGNFLFNTSGVVGEPGFKAFRPILLKKGTPSLAKNNSLTASEGYIPYSLQQRKMNSDAFYESMERLINPRPLDPETAMLDLIQALHEQLLVRVTSVANGEAYLKANPGTVIPMPSNPSAIFEAGGQWENFSTPNRDLRLLIAMDAVTDFPSHAASPSGNYNISRLGNPEQAGIKLQTILDKKVSELSISYVRTNGSLQMLTVSEILKRKEAFEMGYNPNDGIEIRWGAPEGSTERSSCRRHAPANQLEKMSSLRVWFQKRLHPPT